MDEDVLFKQRMQSARDDKRVVVTVRLELPQELSRVHHTFHVSNLKKCYADEPIVMPLEGIHVDDKLQFVEEPVEIMEREIKRLKRSRIPLVKVRWNSRRGPEFTWEREDSELPAKVNKARGIFPPGCNSNFIALIPKTQDAKVIKDFRPISLIGSIYKIIAKILANRLSMVISDLINEVQTAFVPNRQILDGPFILNELISWCKHKKINAMIFKIDFEKAFDSVRWDYLDDILKSFGFGDKWRSWIAGCLNSAKGSVLINGSPTSEFRFHRGLKQGDPLSPFLFILVMESLHCSFSRVMEVGLYKGISINNSFSISHLFYADDAVFVGEWNISNIKTIVRVLKCFFMASGLKINLSKSKLSGIGVSKKEVDEAAAIVGCSTLIPPFQYLGVKIGAPMSRINSWKEVIDKVSSRLSKWKIKTLSCGGRLTLIKSVLNALPLYYMSLYKAPAAVLNELESIRRNFFNGSVKEDRKMTLIRWENILASKSKGGLGANLIKAINETKCKLDVPNLKISGSIWQELVREFLSLKAKGIDYFSFIKRKLGNGENTTFWDDLWLEKLKFGSLDASVHRRAQRLELIESNYEPCFLMSHVHLPQTVDRWSWMLEDDPIKSNILAWKISLDRLPTRFNLSARGLEIQSILLLAKVSEFHGEVGHNTDECMHLRKQIEEMLKAGKLSHLIKEHKQNNGKEQPKVKKKGETSGQDKALTILMVQPWERMARQMITHSFSPNLEIFFPPLGEDEGTEGPMIIEAEIGGHCIHRMYVDGGSASEILYEHCFSRFRPEIKNQLIPATTPLIGFNVTPSDIQHSAAYSDLRVLQIGIRAKVIENQVKTVMSSASSAVTYTSVYTDSEPGRAFWGADDEEISEGGIPRVIVLGYDGLPIQRVAPPSPDYIPGPKDPQTPLVPQDEDEREPMFVQAHDPDYVPEPIYPEYIPLEDEHEFPAEEQPLPPIDSPTAESPGYVTKSDPEKDPEEYEGDETEDGPADYPMDGGDDGDDDDGDSSRDDANEDEDDEDNEDEEEEEYLALADSTIVAPVDEPVFPPEGTEPVIPPPSTDITIGARITVRPQTSISLPPEAEVERLLAMTTPSPSPPISLSPPSTGERLVRSMAPPAHSSPPPVPSPLLPSSGCPTQIQTLRIASTQALIDAVTATLPSPPLPPLPPSLYIPPPIDRRDDIPESEQPPRKRLYLSTLASRYEVWESSTARPTRGRGIDYGFFSTVDAEERVTDLAKLHEHDTQDLYALLEDAQDRDSMYERRRSQCFLKAWALFDRIDPGDSSGASTHLDHVCKQSELAHFERLVRRRQGSDGKARRIIKTRREMSDMQTELLALREPHRRARQPGPEARIPSHQDALGRRHPHLVI
ncbi:RNA-directed DNA polymerase, eukaryota [Tanacetum coccineum]